MLSLRRVSFLLLATVISAVAWQAGESTANDWPGWRGQDRTGVSTETGLLQAWPKDGPTLLWKISTAGTGYSTPAVANGRIYLMGAREGKEQVLALDVKDGKEVWSAEVGAIAKSGPPSYPGPHSTPMIDGDHVYVLGSDGDLVCLTTAGKQVWHKSLTKDLGGERSRWAYAESPLLDGDVLVCTPGGAKATLAALNKKSGEVLWKASVAKGSQAAYASPVAAEAGGVKQYVQFLGGGIVGVAAKDGKLLWRYDKVTSTTNCSTPIVHDGCVFVSASAGGRGGKGGGGKGGGGKGGGGGKMGGGGGGALLRLNSDGEAAKEVYRIPTLGNHHGGVVRVGDYLYGTNADSLLCIDFKTGETKWQNRAVGKGSITAADGRLYVRGERGPMVLVEASPAGYKETGRFEPGDRSGKMAWPHPVVSGGKLYVRDQGVLQCYDVKQK